MLCDAQIKYIDVFNIGLNAYTVFFWEFFFAKLCSFQMKSIYDSIPWYHWPNRKKTMPRASLRKFTNTCATHICDDRCYSQVNIFDYNHKTIVENFVYSSKYVLYCKYLYSKCKWICTIVCESIWILVNAAIFYFSIVDNFQHFNGKCGGERQSTNRNLPL